MDQGKFTVKIKYNADVEEDERPMQKVTFLYKSQTITTKFITTIPYVVCSAEWYNFLTNVENNEESIVHFGKRNSIQIKDSLVTFRTASYNLYGDCSYSTKFTLPSSCCIEPFKELLEEYERDD